MLFEFKKLIKYFKYKYFILFYLLYYLIIIFLKTILWKRNYLSTKAKLFFKAIGVI